MPANVETMAFFAEEVNGIRKSVWHGIGEPVDHAMSSKEALEIAGLDWTVDSKPIFNEDGDQIEGFVANTRSSDNSVLGIVTPKYKIIQNVDAFSFTDNLLGEGVTYETAGSLNRGKSVWLLARMEDSKILDDDFENYLVFSNSHDGMGAVHVACTNVRVVCQNTLNLALSTAKRSWSTRHIGNINEKLEEAKHTLQLAKDYITNLDIEANKLAELKVSDDELEAMFDLMFPVDYEKDTQRKIHNITELKTNLFSCYNATDIKKFKGTAWGILNATADLVDHRAPARLTENYRENLFGKVISGTTLLDNMYTSIQKMKNVA